MAEHGDSTKIHVVFLHNKLRKRAEDRYLIDVAIALKEAGHRVTIYTSEFDQSNCFDEVNNISGCLNVCYSGWWLPSSFKFWRSIVMALKMIFFPPEPKPKVIILDVNTIALYLFSLLSDVKTIYLTHFTSLHQAEYYTKFMKITPDLTNAMCLKRANEVIVQSEGLADIFRRSFPGVKRELKILPPCVDTGLWKERIIDISRIVPDIPKPNFLFVCFGPYKKRSNFKLVLDAFEDLLLISAEKIKNNVHLVIGGHCSDSQLEQKIYYNELLEYTKDKPFASQVTFLRQLPTVHKKTLIEESIGVLIPCKHEIFPDTLLAVLSSGRPIVATNTGFAKEVLRHRISGVLVEPTPQMFAAAMYKILTNPAIQVFLSDMGHDVFAKKFSNDIFSRKINGIVS
ncbi:PREDICTED: alpha-1,3/1,6-mannosyltransferase ALG2-like, partial [Nicrophorus vespilloides]|uniref:Alpha-1,3/1,6-mannosyltransferase ALG2 n=1 Tax=Nicrophorus vespilloides TaxID=110193 RepID=A0ABM1MEA4_NICVS